MRWSLLRSLHIAGSLTVVGAMFCFACVGGGGPLPNQTGDQNGGGQNPPVDEEDGTESRPPQTDPGAPSQAPPDASTTSPDTKTCTPGSFVFCRCPDGEAGTQQCNNDGVTRSSCTCQSSPAPDAG